MSLAAEGERGCAHATDAVLAIAASSTLHIDATGGCNEKDDGTDDDTSNGSVGEIGCRLCGIRCIWINHPNGRIAEDRIVETDDGADRRLLLASSL